MEITVRAAVGFINGSVELIKFNNQIPPQEFYVIQKKDGTGTFVRLKKNWVAQFFQILILRIKYK